MGAKAGIALKALQWFIRGVQFLSAALIFGIYCYFLATLNSRSFQVPDWIRAVVGITGSACLYCGIGLLLLCCLAGHKVTSFIAIVLDIAFAAAFIYVAVANKGGASSCDGVVSTPFGDGDANGNSPSDSNSSGNRDGLPSFRIACKLQSACLAVAIVAILFFIFSAATEVALARHRHKENRFGPSPANDYTSGYGRKGFFGFLKRSGTTKSQDPNALPKHATPADMREPVRDSYATERTAVAEPSPARASYSRDPAPLRADGAAAPTAGTVGPAAGSGSLYPNKYGDDTLPMNTAWSSHNRTTSTVDNPYDNRTHATHRNNPYNTTVNNPYDTSAPGPYPGSYSRPRLSEDSRGPAQQQQYPAGYRYSDGVYDA